MSIKIDEFNNIMSYVFGQDIIKTRKIESISKNNQQCTSVECKKQADFLVTSPNKAYFLCENHFEQITKSIKESEIFKVQWTRAYINDLPDSAFLYIEPGGEKDEENKTKPRRLRHWPIRDIKGKLDINHIRNAIARIPQTKILNMSADELQKYQDKARVLLEEIKENNSIKKRDEEISIYGKNVVDIVDKIQNINICKSTTNTEEEHFVLGIVLVPNDGDGCKLDPDTQNDIYSAQDIEKAAHLYMIRYRDVFYKHDELIKNGVYLVENFIAPVDMEINNRSIIKGTWLAGFKITDKKIWKEIETGKLNALSVGGDGTRILENAA